MLFTMKLRKAKTAPKGDITPTVNGTDYKFTDGKATEIESAFDYNDLIATGLFVPDSKDAD